jgi:hypothetical protein
VSLHGFVNYPGKDLKIEADLFSGVPGTYSLELASTWSPDGSLTAIGSYNDVSTELTLDHRLNLVMRVNQNKPVSLSAKIKAEGRHSSAFGEVTAARNRFPMLEYSTTKNPRPRHYTMVKTISPAIFTRPRA